MKTRFKLCLIKKLDNFNERETVEAKTLSVKISVVGHFIRRKLHDDTLVITS